MIFSFFGSSIAHLKPERFEDPLTLVGWNSNKYWPHTFYMLCAHAMDKLWQPVAFQPTRPLPPHHHPRHLGVKCIELKCSTDDWSKRQKIQAFKKFWPTSFCPPFTTFNWGKKTEVALWCHKWVGGWMDHQVGQGILQKILTDMRKLWFWQNRRKRSNMFPCQFLKN